MRWSRCSSPSVISYCSKNWHKAFNKWWPKPAQITCNDKRMSLGHSLIFFPRFQVQSSLVLTYSVLDAAWRQHSTEAADLAPLKLWSGSCAESDLVAHSPKGKTETLFLFCLSGCISTRVSWGKPVLKSYFCSLTVSQEIRTSSSTCKTQNLQQCAVGSGGRHGWCC